MTIPKRILVVDDEEQIVDVVRAYLIKSGYEVYSAYNGKEAMELFEQVSPALVVLDLMLPDISGEDFCKLVRTKARTPIIMLTAKKDETHIINGLKIGADDYVVKPFKVKELVARVDAVMRRVEGDELTSEPISFDNNFLIIDFKGHIIKREGTEICLTLTEYKILTTLAKSPKRTFTREDIIAFALGADFDGYDRSIDTYIKNIRQKIEPEPKSPKYLVTVHGVGYKFGMG